MVQYMASGDGAQSSSLIAKTDISEFEPVLYHKFKINEHLLVNSRCECSMRKLGSHICIGPDQIFRRIYLKVQNRPKMVCKTHIIFSVGF